MQTAIVTLNRKNEPLTTVLLTPEWTKEKLLDQLREIAAAYSGNRICQTMMQMDGLDPAEFTWNDLFEYMPSSLLAIYSDHKITVMNQYTSTIIPPKRENLVPTDESEGENE